MYKYLTTEEIRRRSHALFSETRIAKVATASSRSPQNATFLSHATSDQELLPGVITLLEEHGADVYVDKLDSSLPPQTNRETASALKSRVEKCRNFIVFATARSKDSRWIPWELGLSDGIKGARRVAILPGVDNATDTDWTEREYLAIYNRIVYGDLEGHRGKVWMVLNQEANTARELSEFLQAW